MRICEKKKYTYVYIVVVERALYTESVGFVSKKLSIRKSQCEQSSLRMHISVRHFFFFFSVRYYFSSIFFSTFHSKRKKNLFNFCSSFTHCKATSCWRNVHKSNWLCAPICCCFHSFTCMFSFSYVSFALIAIIWPTVWFEMCSEFYIYTYMYIFFSTRIYVVREKKTLANE